MAISRSNTGKEVAMPPWKKKGKPKKAKPFSKGGKVGKKGC